VKLRDRLRLRQTPSESSPPSRSLAQIVNAVNRNAAARSLMEKAIGVHPERKLPPYSPARFADRPPRAEAMKPGTVSARRESRRYFRPAT